MKSPKLFFLLLLCLFVGGCSRPAVNSSSAPPAAGVGQETAAQKPPANESKIIASPTPRADETSEVGEANFTGTAAATEKKYEGGAALLTAVRIGRHESFDRIVFEFAGDDIPGYRIEYVDKPVRQCGSGKVVPLAGDGLLEIRFSSTNAHTEAGEPTIKTREMAPNLAVVKELKSTCDFEAEVVWAAGVASPNKYRVLELRNPTRLAVDINH